VRTVGFLYDHDPKTGVATLTLDRPDRLNSLTFEIYDELRRVFRALDTEPDVRAIVLTGTGRGFCSGGDVEAIIGELFKKDAQGLLDFTRMTCDVVAAMRACRRPIVAALNGTVAGAGAMLALAADIRIAAERAKIAFLFTRVGLAGADMGSAYLLPRVVGAGRAAELLMTGDFISATEAHAMGLYNRVVSDGELAGSARAFAERLAKGPQLGIAMTKHLLEREATMDLTAALETEARAQAKAMEHPDFREAYEAFVAKRPPRFR
jgi:enoyl-CoA hydratase/carnithine racemase